MSKETLYMAVICQRNVSEKMNLATPHNHVSSTIACTNHFFDLHLNK